MFRIEKDYLFFKVGQRKYLEDLINKGDLYCNTFEYFAKCDADEVGDSDETVSDLHLARLTKLTFTDKSGNRKTIEMDLPAQLKQRHTGHMGNLYSLYAFKYSEHVDAGEFTLPDSMFKFGDTVVLILDIHEFLARIEKKLAEEERGHKHGFIKYLDYKTYSGDRQPFQKDISFQHQQEYRIYLHPKIGELKTPVKISIGSISDIAVITATDKFTLQFDQDN